MDTAAIGEKARREWPASLAILTLVVGHIALVIVAGSESLQPFGLPLFAAIAVFFVGEVIRQFT